MTGLKNLVTVLTTCSEKYCPKINIQKTKYMNIGRKNNSENIILKIRNNNIEKVNNFKYLGVLINEQ